MNESETIVFRLIITYGEKSVSRGFLQCNDTIPFKKGEF